MNIHNCSLYNGACRHKELLTMPGGGIMTCPIECEYAELKISTTYPLDNEFYISASHPLCDDCVKKKIFNNNPICSFNNLREAEKWGCEKAKRLRIKRTGSLETTYPLDNEPERMEDMKKYMQTFSTGATRETKEGKGRYDLVSTKGLKRLAKHYQRCISETYPERSWEKGLPISSCLDSALRHIYDYIDGSSTDEDALASAAWNIFAAMHSEDNPLCRDMPWMKEGETDE